jgi:hypothetical protein
MQSHSRGCARSMWVIKPPGRILGRESCREDEIRGDIVDSDAPDSPLTSREIDPRAPYDRLSHAVSECCVRVCLFD